MSVLRIGEHGVFPGRGGKDGTTCEACESLAIVASGDVLVTLDPASTLVLDEDAGEGLAVSGDGSFLCGGYRDGSVVCFERSP